MKRFFEILLCICVCISLCGCDIFVFDTDKLLSPPELGGELYQIKQALIDSIKGDYTLKYPSSGDIKSAVVTEDLNGDGVKEAFVFYNTSDEEESLMHINLIIKNGKEYKSAYDSSITASGIEKIEFLDLDGDGVKEIIAGWEIYADSEKQLAVYGFSENALTQLMLQKYTNFLCLDLDKNGKTEIMIQELDTKQSVNKASIYSLSEKGVSQIAGCLLDGKVKSVSKFELSTLSNGQPAVYIDEIKGIGAVTEVLFMSKGELKNPLLDSENTMENIKTVRSASIGFADVNNDGITEIPISSDMPCADAAASEKIYYTNWCSFSGESLTVKQVSLENTADGYSINIPKKLIGNIAVLKNIEKRTRTIFSYDSKLSVVGKKLITFKAMNKSEFEKEEIKENGYQKIFSKDDTVIVVQIEKGQENVITKKETENIIGFNTF